MAESDDAPIWRYMDLLELGSDVKKLLSFKRREFRHSPDRSFSSEGGAVLDAE